MPLYFARILRLTPSTEGWVANADEMAVSIVCRRDTLSAEWEPLFGLKNDGGGRIQLPHCFQLDELASDALENAFIAEMEGYPQ